MIQTSLQTRAALRKRTVKDKALRLLGYALLGALPVAMSSPPTITSGASATITNNVYAQNDPAITYLGTVAAAGVGALGTDFHASHSDKNAQLANYRSGVNMNIVFDTDAPDIEFLTFNNSAKYRIFVNEQAYSLTPTQLASGSARTYVKVAFGSSAPRRIRIECSNIFNFGGVRVATNYSIWKSDIDTMRTMVCGDSWVDGQYGDGTSDMLLHWANQYRYRMGMQDCFLNGQSGGGWLKTGTQSGKKFGDTIQNDVIAYAPDQLAICLGINDPNAAGGSTALEQAEVTSVMAALLKALPNTIFTVFGPWRGPSLNPSQAWSDAIKAGVQAQPEFIVGNKGRIGFIDTYAEGFNSTGAGKVGATSGNGNSNIYIGADGGHLIGAGQDHHGWRVARAVTAHLKAIAAAP